MPIAVFDPADIRSATDSVPVRFDGRVRNIVGLFVEESVERTIDGVLMPASGRVSTDGQPELSETRRSCGPSRWFARPFGSSWTRELGRIQHVTPEVIIVGAKDRELERLLVECNMRTSALSAVASWSSLAHPVARQPDVVLIDVRGDRGAAPGARRRSSASTRRRRSCSSPRRSTRRSCSRRCAPGSTRCVAEPLSAAELENAITRLLVHKSAPAAGQVFAFIGAKGGVGTTTTAVNVATELNQTEPGKTLLVDLHLAHGDAAVFLGVEPRFSVVDALDNIHRFDEAFFKGLVVQSPAGPQLLASSDRALVQSSSVQRVRSLIEFATQLYRYVVLDVPRSDAAALDALDQAVAHRRRRQPGAGDGPQRQPHRRVVPAALRGTSGSR